LYSGLETKTLMKVSQTYYDLQGRTQQHGKYKKYYFFSAYATKLSKPICLSMIDFGFIFSTLGSVKQNNPVKSLQLMQNNIIFISNPQIMDPHGNDKAYCSPDANSKCFERQTVFYFKTA
jgi:hypothetical protein